MKTQVTVRLPAADVAFIDGMVSGGEASSRAEAIAYAIERERRRRADERDIAILTATADEHDPDGLDALAAYAARTPLPDLD